MRRFLMAMLVTCSMAPAAMAAIANIDSVSAGTSGSPPNMLQSVTVGGYTANRADLQVGTTTALPGGTDTNSNFFGSWEAPYAHPAPSSNFDLNDILARNGNDNPIVVKNFGGLPLWSDVNGADPDFFVFESASGAFGDSGVTVQAILPGDILGVAVGIGDTGAWGDTGLTRTGNPNNGQSIRGVSFAVTDLQDANGVALPSSAQLLGLQINSAGIDPSLIAAVAAPEPATAVLVVIGALVLPRRRSR
jgi:hypothetical protein